MSMASVLLVMATANVMSTKSGSTGYCKSSEEDQEYSAHFDYISPELSIKNHHNEKNNTFLKELNRKDIPPHSL